ncbi:MAG: zinc ribbon domain-containing protein [Blastocatellia bacterium]|nr:zinc ribbon domain-containing protein [Blastocatellia bacterium]
MVISSYRVACLAIAGIFLLITSTIVLVTLRSRAESIVAEIASSDQPLLKNRWPAFKKSVETLHQPLQKVLQDPSSITVSSEISTTVNKIIEEHSYTFVNQGNGRIVPHIEIIFFEKDSVNPYLWFWLPKTDNSLKNRTVRTWGSLQQIEQTELILATGSAESYFDAEALTSQRRALIFFYLHIEWTHYEDMIRVAVRSTQLLALITIFAISFWVYLVTKRLGLAVFILFMSLAGLVVYSSILLKALSLRTVLQMLIAIQFGAKANKAVDFAGLFSVAGACYGLTLVGLLRLPVGTHCPGCNFKVAQHYRFCPQCNYLLKNNCRNCGAATDKNWHYCPNCSEEL